MERLSELTKTIGSDPKGTGFTRLVLGMLRTAKSDRGGLSNMRAYCEEQCTPGRPWASTPGVASVARMFAHAGSSTFPSVTDPRGRNEEVQKLIKGAVAAGDTTTSGWASPLVSYAVLASEFISALRPQTIIGRLSGARRLPFNVKLPRSTTAASGAWVGEGQPIPAAALALDAPTLTADKMGVIVVLTDELVNNSSPAAEDVARTELTNALVAFGDQQFIDPTVTALAGVHPASVTNGAATVSSSGSTVAQITSDVKMMFAIGIAADVAFAQGAWIMHPRTALYLGSVLTAGNVPMWPTVNIRGGTWFGLPVITSTAVPVETGDTTFIVLVDASEIFVADDDGITVEAAAEASVQMQSGPSAGAQPLVSLWQNNLVGLKATRYLSYTRRNDPAVVVLASVAY